MSTDRQWESLKPGPYGLRADQPGVDPKWVWADATRYRDHMPQFNAARGLWVVEDKSGQAPYSPYPFASRKLTKAQWSKNKLALAPSTFELAEPVVPERARMRGRLSRRLAVGTIQSSDAKVLIGIIDSGCPFAAEMIRDASGHGTRVLSIWDQDESPSFANSGGHIPPDLGYGCAVNKSTLNDLMQRASKRDGFVDEDLCYRLADYDCVRERFSHGAAVMSQLFARPIHGGALQPRPGTPPAWDSAENLRIDSADLVFVQLPRAGAQDSTSGALTRYVIDGLRYIAACAQAEKTQRIIVNISSGTSRTMHDGTSMLERALKGWIEFVKFSLGIEAWIVLPVGNTNLEQRHAVLSDEDGHLELFLPPACEMPQYVTVRWPAGLEGVHLRVTPPDGQSGTIRQGEAMGWPNAAHPECGVVSAKPGGGAACSLLAFAPTASHDRRRTIARSGRWRIELVFDEGRGPLNEKDPVRFWISRNQRNPGALSRGRQADFVDWDETHSPQRYLRQMLDDLAPVRNGIQRDGALSGMATVPDPSGRVVIVGGYVVSDLDLTPSKYSAAGPATSEQLAVIPTFTSAPCDSSWAISGLSVRGNRSGEVMRVVGTSFAAPLKARALANQDDKAPDEKPDHVPKQPKDYNPRRGAPLRRT